MERKMMMMMMMLELAPTPSDLVMEPPGDPSSSSLHPSFCSSAIENQRRFSTRKDKLKKRMAKPKSQLFQRNQSPCRHSIMNQTNSLDFPGLPLMYLTNHCTSDSCHSRTH